VIAAFASIRVHSASQNFATLRFAVPFLFRVHSASQNFGTLRFAVKFSVPTHARDQIPTMPEEHLLITTERLRLRPISWVDVDEVFDLNADPAVRRFIDMPKAPSLAEVRQDFLRLLERYGPGRDEPSFRVAESHSGAFLGWFHLRPEGPEHALNLGYRLGRRHWGKGYATEGAALLRDRAFLCLGAQWLVANALEANTASIRVMEKIGMTFEEQYLHRGALPAVRYGMSREMFLSLTRAS
jgi:RimJ/RimL family protein N-acetyltransferase